LPINSIEWRTLEPALKNYGIAAHLPDHPAGHKKQICG
jgi:hypothetical protein